MPPCSSSGILQKAKSQILKSIGKSYRIQKWLQELKHMQIC